MLQSLLSTLTVKAVGLAAGAATLAGGAAAVTLPEPADDKAVETVEQIEAGEQSDPAQPIEVTEEEGAEPQNEGTPPEDTFGATVHELQAQFPDRGEDFGQAVAAAAKDHAAERRDAAPIPDVARARMGEPGADDADEGGEAEADAGPPEDVPAGPPAGTPGGRPGG